MKYVLPLDNLLIKLTIPVILFDIAQAQLCLRIEIGQDMWIKSDNAIAYYMKREQGGEKKT